MPRTRASSREPGVRGVPVSPRPLLRALPWAVPLAAALLLLFRAPALWVWRAWWADPYYTHGLPVFLAAAGLAAWRLRRAGHAPAPVPAWGLLGIPLAAALYLAGFLLHSPHLLAWSGLAGLAALALATGGPARVRLLAGPFLLAALTLPTPWTLPVGVALQDLATRGGAALLALLGVPLAVGLTTFSTGGLAFEVTPACSGFQGAVALLALAALVAAAFPMPPARRRLVLLAAVPLALLLNVVRIAAVVLVGLQWGADAAEGFFHGASSALLFLAEALVLLLLAGAHRRPAPGGAAPA